MAVIQAPNFTMNPYERFQVLNRQNQWYDESRWQTAAKEGSLAREADIISRAEKELGDYDAYVQKYHLDRAPDNQMLYLALTKDLYADDTELKDYTFEEWNPDKKKEVLHPITNKNGNTDYAVTFEPDPGYETVTKQMTEKQYLEKLLNDWIEYDNALLQQAQIEQARKNLPWYKKAGAAVGDFFINSAQGIDNTLQGIGDFFSGVGAGFKEGFKALFRGDNPFPAFLEGYRNDPKNQTGSNSNLQALADALNIDYNNVWLQDANGNYNQAGQIISDIATTLGEMAPSILANAVLPGIASINLGGASLTAGATKAIGTGTMAAYYTSMWNRRNVERFNDPDFASVPTWSILLESTVQTATDIVIEQTLGKLIGASGIDKLMYGAAAAGGSGITKLTKANVIKKLIANGLHEGIEEVSQDVVANITTQLLGLKWEAFGKDDITWDDIVNTFVVSFTIGILGAGVEMLGTERRVVGEDVRLSKGKSWLANMNEQALWQQYQKLASNKNMTTEQRMKLMSSMRISMETIASMYTAFGEDTMARINGRLNQIQQRLENMPQFVYEQSVNPDYRQERMVELSREYVGAVQDSLHQLEMDSLGIDSYAEMDVTALEGEEKAQVEQYNKYRQLERELAERRKNIDGSEKNQTTGDKLRDANIYQVHDFISAQDTNVQPNEKKGRTQKRTNLAKKIAKATGKNTAYSNGTNVVETDSTYIVPGNMADNCSDMEVLRAAAENELVDTLVTKLDRKILNQFRDAYRATQSDKRKASYEDTVRALLFNEDFARVMFANANDEMYGFISNLQQVLKIAAGNKLADKMMSRVIDSVITAYKPIIAEYVTNQQNADINQLYNRGIFTEQELNDIRRNRWGLDLTNKIQDQKTYNKLTENEQRVIDNRANYLTIDKALKDQIKSDLKSSSVAARMRAMRQLDAEYSNKFFSKYNNRIYFERTTPANNWFNDFMQKTGINLINIKTGKYSKAFLDVVANAVDDQNNHYKSPNDYIVDQFEEYTQGAYSVTIDGVRVIPLQNNIDTSIYTEGAMDYYNDLYGITQSAMQEQAGTWVIPSHDIELMNKVIKNIVDGAKVDDVNLAYTNINDVVQNPFNYLTSEVLNDIMEDYKEVNNYTTFQYLRDLILDKYETISLSRKQNGDIVFVDLTSAYNSLVPNIANMSKSTNSIFNKYVGKGPVDITTFIQKKYLSPELEGYKVVFINDPNATAGDHNYLTKTITINGAKTNAFTKFVLLHEMQHAIQSVNKLAGGMSPYFVVSDQLLTDFEKNMPQLFGKDTNIETKKDIVRWFLYRTASGEVDANLYGDSIAFVQTLVKNSIGDTAEIVTPWGTEYKIRFETKAQAKQRSKAPKTQIKTPKTRQIQQDERVDESLKERQQIVASELERRLAETDAEITHVKNSARDDARRFLEYAVQEYGDIDFRIKGTKIPNSSITWQEVMDLAGYTEEDIVRIYNEAVDKEYKRMAAEHDRSQYSTMSDDYYEDMLRTSAKNYVRDHVKFGDKVSSEYTDLERKTKNTIYMLQKLEKGRDDLASQLGRSNEALELRDYDTGDIITVIDPKQYPEFYKATVNWDELTKRITETIKAGKSSQELKWYDIVLESDAVNDYLANPIGFPISFAEKTELLDKINSKSKLKNAMLHIAHVQLAPGLSYKEFLNIDIPYVRFTSNDQRYDAPFVSVMMGESAIDNLAYYLYNFPMSTIWVGSVKPKDLLGYIPNELTEGLIDSKTFNKAKSFHAINISDGGQEKTTMNIVSNLNNHIDATTWLNMRYTLVDYNNITSDIKNKIISANERIKTLVDNTTIFESKTTKIPDNAVEIHILPSGKMGTIQQQVATYYATKPVALFIDAQVLELEEMDLIIKPNGDAWSIIFNPILSSAQLLTASQILAHFAKNQKLSLKINGRTYNISDISSTDYNAAVAVIYDGLVRNYTSLSNRNSSNEAFEGPENDAQPKQTNKFVQRRIRKGKPGTKKRYNSERDYISRDFAKGTNLEPFVGRYIARDMQEFIMEASPTRLPYELWSKIENGTLNYYDVHNYFRTNPDIDDYTFNLIRNSFWPNSWFKTNKELNQFLELDLRYFYALSNVLYEAGFDVDVTKPMTREAIMLLYEQISQSPEFKEKLERKSANAFDTARLNKQTRKIEYIPLDIDFAHLRVSAMELMDGSIDGAAHVIATARAIATSQKYGQTWNTADIKKTAKSLDESTKGHKADDGESGTVADIIADVKTSRDMLDQALENKIASSTKLQKSMLLYEYYGNIIRKKHPDYASWSDGQQRKAMKLIQKKVNSLTEEEFEAMYRKALSKQLGVNYSERAINNKNIDVQKHSAQVRRNNIVRSIKSFASQVTNYAKTSQWKNIPDTYKQYFDEDGKLKSSVYEETDLSPDEQGEFPQLRDIQSKLASLASALRRGDFTTKSGGNVFLRNQKLKEDLQSEKGKNKKLKAQLALVSKKGTFIIQSQSQEFKMQSDIDIPEKLKTLLNTQFDKTAQSFVQYIKNPDSEHTVYNAKQFFEKNAALFDKITVDEIEQIIRFFDSALLLEADEVTLDKFKILQIYTLAHFIEGAREGRWNISSQYLEIAEKILHRVSDAGRQLAAWRSVMYKVNPNKVLTQKFAESLGVEVDEEDISALAAAVKTGDVRKIHRAQQNLLRNTLMKYKSVDVAKVKNTVLNAMVDEKGTDLSIILATPNIALNEQTKQAIATKYGSVNKENVIKYIQEQTKNVDKNVSFEETSEGYNFISRTDKRATTKILKKLTDKANATINDVITKPNKFLTEKAKAKIKETYGVINEKAILLYAQDVAIDTTKSVMPIKTAEGYQFVDFSNNKSTIMNKLLTFQKAMMLSGPNTVLRNQVSNITLYYGNELADVLGHFVTKIATKVKRKIKPNQKVALTKVDQYDLTGVKVTDEVYNFVQKQIIDNHLLELIEDGASKYDTRKSKANTGVDVLTDMVVNTIIGDIARNNTYNNDVMNSIVQTIFKWQSDAHFINKAAKRYIGKLLTVTQVDITKGLSEDVMKVIAEAYRFAAFEYMHKTNVMNELENKLRERAPKIYAGYKMIFPFMPSAWNWFVESMNWSPVGIIRGITQLCRLEKTVDKIIDDRQKGKLTLDPRLTKFMAQRTLGKGILGSFLLGLGILLGSIGVMQVDDDDDKIKIKIGDIYFDISSVFGTTSLLVGAQLAQPSEGNFLNVLEPAFNLVAEESFFGDLSDIFSYNKTAWDVLLEKPADILGTFVPNFLKSINKLFYTHEVKYSSNVVGSLQYLAASSIPFLAYAFPKKVDPFTGETQSRYGLPFALDFLTDFINVASPIRVKPKNVSWMEEQAIMLGLNKSELSGKYDDIGQVDYQILNTKYGQLNAKDLARLMNNQQRYTVEDKNTGKEKDLFWSQMTDEQKKTVIERIMSYNSRYAKIYTWTQSGHKYYASNSEWQTLRKLGIAQNVFKGDKGFVA